MLRVSVGRRLGELALLLGLAVMTPVATAEQFVAQDDYEVHYIVVGSMFLTPEVARAYQLERAKTKAIVSLSVLKDGRPVNAVVTGTARDLLSRSFDLDFREIVDRGSIYYISSLRFSEEELWRFRLNVTPTAEPARNIPVEFDQKLYLEK